MEQNQFEGLETVETFESEPNQQPELKEYQKLLLVEEERQDNEKAKTLVGFGCFDQKEVTTFDYSKNKKITMGKKLKGKYDLYKSLENNQLLYVCPLVEDNKGETGDDVKKDAKAYAYDVLYIDQMDDETYKKVVKAGKNNISTWISVAHKASFVLFFVLCGIALYYIIYTLATNSSTDFFYALAQSFYGAGIYLVGAVIMIPVLILESIAYKKYKN